MAKAVSTRWRQPGPARRLLPPAYLLLLAIYPILALAAANPHQGIRLDDLIFPSLAAIWFALVSWVASGLFTRDLSRRAMIAAVWIAWFAGYGYVAPVLAPVARAMDLGLDTLRIPATFATGVAVSLWMARSRYSFSRASRALGAASCILIVLPAIVYLSGSRRIDTAAAWDPGPLPAVSSAPTTRPDIYFIVLDMYTGSKSLKRNFGYDNSPFVADLEARGFFVPRESRSNYLTTFLALAAMLNWTYLDELPIELDERSMDRSFPAAMIEDSRAVRFLKAAGYEFVFMPSSYAQTAANRNADRVLGPRGDGPAAFREFLVAWVGTTPARPLLEIVCLMKRCKTHHLPFAVESAERIRWMFALLGRQGRQQGPKFVFAHLLVPHVPYVLERDCSSRPQVLWGAMDSLTDRLVREAYVEQLQCVNRLVLELVDRIMVDSPEPPIIVLQADHGHGRWRGIHHRPPIAEAHPDAIRERADIFAAYHMPGARRKLYDSITPVNVFPVMFRHYFGAEIPPVEDRTYYSSHVHPYRFTRLH